METTLLTTNSITIFLTTKIKTKKLLDLSKEVH